MRASQAETSFPISSFLNIFAIIATSMIPRLAISGSILQVDVERTRTMVTQPATESHASNNLSFELAGNPSYTADVNRLLCEISQTAAFSYFSAHRCAYQCPLGP